MVYTLKEFLLLDLTKRNDLPKALCYYCFEPITNSSYTMVDKKVIHIECYQDEFSNFLDKNPIGGIYNRKIK